ncbi:hypothetical protein QZH41_009751, partial [Actinostola sp. cb2023]
FRSEVDDVWSEGLDMSSFFKQLFPFMKVKKKKEFSYISKGVDPNSLWDLVGELGDGSFGKVYKAQHKTESILAAAKIITVNDESDLEDFMVEIDILSEVKHKNVVGLHETYYHNGKLWMMLEFCPGGALDDLMLEIERGLNEKEIKAVCRQLFEGLNVLHTNKIIHRDLKAGNLLLSNDGQIKIADFGVSAKNKKTLQRRTTFIGTPYWMAPEVVVTETCKDNPYDYKSDIWSAGVTIVELANMVPPNHAMHPMRVLFKIPKADPPTLEGRRWSKDLKDFLACCVVKSPEMRATAVEMLKHPFLEDSGDSKVLKDLYNEAKAEVIEEIEDLPEDTEVRIKCDKDDDNRLKSSDSDEFLDDNEQDEKELDDEQEVENEKKDQEVYPVEGEKDSIENRTELENNELKEENKESSTNQVETVAKEVEKDEDVSKSEAEDTSVSKTEKPEEKDESIPRDTEEEKDESIPRDTEEEKEESIPRDTEEEKDESIPRDTEEEKDESIRKDTEKEESIPNDTEEKDETSVDKGKEEQQDEVQEEKSKFTEPDKQEESTPEDPEETLPPDKYSTRLDNILDEMEDVDDKDKKSTEETPEEAPTEKNEEKEIEDKDETSGEKQEEKEIEETKDENEKDNEISTEEKKELDILHDKKDDNEKVESEQDGPGGPTGQAKEFQIYTDDDDVTKRIEKALEEKKAESTTDGKMLNNGALLAAELKKETVEKKEPEQTGERHFKTLKRTRKFATQDGKIVTETTSRVVDVSGEDFKNALMKGTTTTMNLRDLKLLQRQEQKQGMELMSKIRRQWEAQEQRFEQEMQDLDKKVEAELDTLSRNQKREIEKLELTQNADLRASSRKMKQDQEKELRKFKENLKEESKKNKKDVDKLPRPKRKETWKKKKEELELSHRQAEHEFLAMQQTEFEKFYKQMIDLHRQKMFEMEMQFLESKHERKRAHESEKWEMEFRHLNERHTLAKTQLKETFFLQRSQMLNRHLKEVEQHQHLTKLQEDEMKRRHEIERKRLPKIQRNEIKTKSLHHRKTLRDKKVSLDIEREQLKMFEEIERKRARSEYEKMLLRQDLEAEELRTSSDSALKELQQLQNEKRHMLMESETLKLKERDDKHNGQMMSWKADLGPRKKTLEEEFAREKREQQLFYARGGDIIHDTPPNDLRVPGDNTSSRDSFDGSGGSQTGSQRTPDDTSSGRSSTGSMEI